MTIPREAVGARKDSLYDCMAGFSQQRHAFCTSSFVVFPESDESIQGGFDHYVPPYLARVPAMQPKQTHLTTSGPAAISRMFLFAQEASATCPPDPEE
jgi:hypothetical protein